MCKISDFSSVLEIAFGLSAVFYYLEIREAAEAKIKEAATLNEVARSEAEDTWRSDLVASVMMDSYEVNEKGEIVSQVGGMLSLAPPSPAKKKLIDRMNNRWKESAGRAMHLSSVGLLIQHSPLVTKSLAFISTVASLGALLWSGYNPEVEYNCWVLTAILASSYLSVSWILLWYQVALPLLIRRRSETPAPARQA